MLGQVWPSRVALGSSEAWEIPLDQERWIVATHTASPTASSKAVIIVHGLGGHQELFHIVRLAQALHEEGYHVVRMNMQGRGPSVAGSKNPLRGGHSDDLARVVETVYARLDLRQVELLGYSFGGNMVLRYVGAAGDSGYPEVKRCFAVSAPVDLGADLQKLKRVVPPLLQKRVTKKLVELLVAVEPEAFERGLGDVVDFEAFEQQYIGPVLADAGEQEFYRSISAGPHVHKITTPTHVIWSRDDPVVDVQAYQNYEFSAAVQGYRTSFGGHVGFCRPFRLPPKRWWLDELLMRGFRGEL